MPSAARPESDTLPSSTIWSAIFVTVEDGIANPDARRRAVLAARDRSPPASECRSPDCPGSPGRPPLLPGLIAADVCTMLAIVAPVPPPERPSLTVRPVADTMPCVTLDDGAERRPHRQRDLPDLDLRRVRELRRPQPVRHLLQLDHGEGPGPDTRTRASPISGVSFVDVVTLNVSLVAHHMGVRHDVALVVVDDTRAEAGRGPGSWTTDGSTSLITFW